MSWNSFTFDGKNSYTDFGLLINKKTINEIPERDLEIVEVPGRDGEIVIDNGRYKNMDVKYTVVLQDTKVDSRRIAAWLTIPRYAILRDTYRPDAFRYAIVKNKINIEDLLDGYGACEITFSCLPYLYYNDGSEFVKTVYSGASAIDLESLVMGGATSKTFDWKHYYSDDISVYPIHQWRCTGTGNISQGSSIINIGTISGVKSGTEPTYYYDEEHKYGYVEYIKVVSGADTLVRAPLTVTFTGSPLYFGFQHETYNSRHLARWYPPRAMSGSTVSFTYYRIQPNWRTI